MTVALVAALTRNRVIGRAGALPWRLREDLRRFKALTRGHSIVMGRKTWETLDAPLPDRHHILITRQAGYAAPGADVVHDLDAALAAARSDPVFILGGGEIYRLALPRADRMHLTHIDAELEGDAFFPEFDESDWRIVDESFHTADDRNEYDCRFVTYERDT